MMNYEEIWNAVGVDSKKRMLQSVGLPDVLATMSWESLSVRHQHAVKTPIIRDYGEHLDKELLRGDTVERPRLADVEIPITYGMEQTPGILKIIPDWGDSDSVYVHLITGKILRFRFSEDTVWVSADGGGELAVQT